MTIEDDETPGVRVSRLRMTLQEDPNAGGGTGRNVGTYTMVLTSGISGTGAAVGVRVRSQNRDAVRVRTDWDPFVPGSGEWRVLFSPSNWNVPQTVTVTAQSDPDGRDEEVVLINEYFAIDGNARNQGYINARGFVIETPIPDTTVTVADDETPALVVDTDPGTAGVQTGALEVREGSAATAVYTVALGVVPTAAVTVSVNNGDSSAVTLSPPTLTFTTQNWNTAQTVTATPVANDADGEHERVTVTHTLTGAVEYVPPALPASRVPGVTVAVTDDDAASARIYTSNPSPLVQGSLNGATVGVQVTNTTWAAGVQTTAAVDSYFALDTTVPGLTLGSIASVPTTGTATLNLAYDGTAFDTPRTLKVRVLAAAHAGSGNLVTGAAPVTPTPGLTIAPTTGLRTTESGGTATFTVRLATRPAGAVALTLASSNTDEGTVSPTTMTFAPSAWQTPQTVTLTGVDDDMATPPNPADGTQSYTVTLTVDQANTADDTYDGMAPVRLTAYNQDNEFGLAVGSVAGWATEAGGTATFTVALQTQPTAAGDGVGREPGYERRHGVAAVADLHGGRGGELGHGADGDGDRRSGRRRRRDGDVAGAPRPVERRRQLQRPRERRRGRGHHRRRRRAGGDAGAEPGVGVGERRHLDGDGAAVARLRGGDDADGDGGLGGLHGGFGRGGGGRDRGGGDDEHGHGAGDGGGQRHRRAGPDGDGDRDGGERPGGGRFDDDGGDGRDTDADRRRPRHRG